MHLKYFYIYPLLFLIISPSTILIVGLILRSTFPDDILYFFIIISYLLLVFLANLTYGLYAIRYAHDNYVTGKNYWKRIVEFEFIKKTLLIGLPILFVSEVLLLYFYYFHSFLNYYLLITLSAFTISLFFGGVIRILVQVMKKDFRYYFAKGSCKFALEMHGDIQKIKYLFLAIDSYNSYLGRNTKYRIKDIQKVHSILLFADNKDELLKSIYNTFINDDKKLKLAEYLAELSYTPNIDFLVKERLIQKLRSVVTFFAAAIPIAISVIQLFL